MPIDKNSIQAHQKTLLAEYKEKFVEPNISIEEMRQKIYQTKSIEEATTAYNDALKILMNENRKIKAKVEEFMEVDYAARLQQAELTPKQTELTTKKETQTHQRKPEKTKPVQKPKHSFDPSIFGSINASAHSNADPDFTPVTRLMKYDTFRDENKEKPESCPKPCSIM